MTLTTDLEALTPDTPAERVRELNEQCLLALGWRKVWSHLGEDWYWLRPGVPDGIGQAAKHIPQLLTSVDDAIAALPEGWDWCLYTACQQSGARAQLEDGRLSICDQTVVEAIHDRPATALTIANLKRLEQ